MRTTAEPLIGPASGPGGKDADGALFMSATGDFGGRGRALDGQGEPEDDSAAGSVLGPHPGDVRQYDPSANGETQPGALNARRNAAIELFEHALLVTGGKPRTTVSDRRRQVRRGGRDLDFDRASHRRVLDSVVEQIDQHLLDQDGIEWDERQILGQTSPHPVVLKVSLETSQRRTDDVFQWLALFASPQPGFEPGHVEQVVHQPGETIGLFVDRFLQIDARHRVEELLALQEAARGAGDRSEWGAKIV